MASNDDFGLKAYQEIQAQLGLWGEASPSPRRKSPSASRYNDSLNTPATFGGDGQENDNFFMDDDDELIQETIHDKVTKESFISMVKAASDGGDFLKVINRLPNSSQQYGHSLTMNAVINIICRHATFKDRCTRFYTTKIKSGKETKVVSTYNTLNQSNKELLRCMI